MAEYIDLESVYNVLVDENPFGWTNDDLAEAIRNAIPADAVEVVRCKDCKHYSYSKLCFYHGIRINEYAFCSYGERKEK
ncbi:MAG: hypothetical protein ACOYBL_13910 [Lachnospiraceae bacterium]|jgi:hypothetical protein